MCFADGGALKSEVDALDLGPASLKLQRAVESISSIPFDDSVAESPHAAGNHIGRFSHGSAFPWVASSMRLKQNIEDVKTWCGALQLDWKQEWLMYSSLLQTSRPDRPLRIPASEFYNRFYFMSHLCPDLRQPVNDDEEVLALEDAPAADDDHAAPSISGAPEGPGPAAPPRPARRVGNRESEQMAMMKNI